MANLYRDICRAVAGGEKLLAILIDPEKFNEINADVFLKNLPAQTDYLFVGGSTTEALETAKTIEIIKNKIDLPVILFPGDHSQISKNADAVLFLSLISGRNPEYLIEQQVKSVGKLKNSNLEIIPTGYILIDGGKECAVQKVSGTTPISQKDIETIVNTALAGQYSGKSLIYLEAGSGAREQVSEEIISEVKKAIDIPLIVGGGIRSIEQLRKSYKAGADMVVVGTVFENGGLLFNSSKKFYLHSNL